jgi:hypothetical protein
MNDRDSPSLLAARVDHSNTTLMIPGITQVLYQVSRYRVPSPVIVVPVAL